MRVNGDKHAAATRYYVIQAAHCPVSAYASKLFKQGVLARNLLFFWELCFHGDFLSEIRKHVSCIAIANTTCRAGGA